MAEAPEIKVPVVPVPVVPVMDEDAAKIMWKEFQRGLRSGELMVLPFEDERPAPKRQPAVGRIVHFHPGKGDMLSTDQRELLDPANKGNFPSIYPAIITRVWSETTVNLSVFDDMTAGTPVYRDVELMENIDELASSRNNCWSWPALV